VDGEHGVDELTGGVKDECREELTTTWRTSGGEEEPKNVVEDERGEEKPHGGIEDEHREEELMGSVKDDHHLFYLL